IFDNWAPTDTLRYPLELVLFPLVSWAAIRFGQRGATTGIIIIALLAVYELRDVIGPEATKYHTQSPTYLWVFVGIVSLTGLFLGAILTENRNREESIRRNEERLRAFLEAMPDTAFILRPDGTIVDLFASHGSVFQDIAKSMSQRNISLLFDNESLQKAR